VEICRELQFHRGTEVRRGGEEGLFAATIVDRGGKHRVAHPARLRMRRYDEYPEGTRRAEGDFSLQLEERWYA